MSSLHVVPQVPLDDPDDTTCMTFVLNKEDHTLGNALRYIIMKKYVARLYMTVEYFILAIFCCDL